MNYLDYSIIFLYLAALLAFGYLFRHQSDKQSYFLGGRSLGWFPLTLSTMATQLSAISFVSAPAFVGMREGGGMKWLTYEFGVPLAMILLVAFVMPVLYRSGIVSIYDFLERRFGLSTRIFLSVVFQVSRAFATGIMVYAVAIILEGTAGVPFWQSLVIIGVITVLYSLQGGMSAVVYGDAIQMILIFLGTLICLFTGLYHLGGFDSFMASVDVSRMQAVDFSSFGFDGEGFGVAPMVFGGIVLYASYYGCDQSQAQRSLSAQSVGQMRKILIANSVFRFPITVLYCTSGLVIGTLAFQTPAFLEQIPEGRPDYMIPIFIIEYLPHGVIGLLVVAILAAAMSSLSSAVNSLAAVTVEDYQRLARNPISDHKYLVAARWVGFFWGAVVLFFSIFGGAIAATVIEAINKVGSVFYGPILAIFLLAVMTKRVGAIGANVGLGVGVLTNLYLWLAVPSVFWFWWNFIGCVVGLVFGYGASLLFEKMPPPGDSHAILAHSRPLEDLRIRDLAILLALFVVIVGVSVAYPTIMQAL